VLDPKLCGPRGQCAVQGRDRPSSDPIRSYAPTKPTVRITRCSGHFVSCHQLELSATSSLSTARGNSPEPDVYAVVRVNRDAPFRSFGVAPMLVNDKVRPHGALDDHVLAVNG